jgi:aerotaxis receptor
LPVTQREVEVPPDTTLMSTTDPDSRITYANGAFVQMSGFARDELVGQPHNLVRHPDMPPQAFADLWRTLRAGLPWSALVKNRRKNGDHYWVRANVAAVRRDDRLIGYMSVRTRAEPAEIAAAERLYAAIRDGRAGGIGFERGHAVRTGWRRPLSAAALMPLSARTSIGVALAVLPTALTTLLAPWVAGWANTPALSGAGLTIAASLIGVVLAGLYLHTQIVSPLRRVLEQAKAVASGQAVMPVVLPRVDEIGMLMRSVNQAGLNVRALVDDVAEQIEGVETASREIADGSQHLSQRTEQAAASLQQTAAAMEQLAETIQRNSESATEVRSLAQDAQASAQRGGAAVGGVVEQMRTIGESSSKIVDIVRLIDSIAFQTNILALNAAVEAARAGEQGRGFAVVASEVRALARRSADAAREVKALIDGSVTAIAAGGTRVDEAGSTSAQLVSQVERVHGLVEDIARASSEQAIGVSQVRDAVSDMDRTTQQNAALVEQTAAAATGLRDRAAALADAIGVFRVR